MVFAPGTSVASEPVSPEPSSFCAVFAFSVGSPAVAVGARADAMLLASTGTGNVAASRVGAATKHPIASMVAAPAANATNMHAVILPFWCCVFFMAAAASPSPPPRVLPGKRPVRARVRPRRPAALLPSERRCYRHATTVRSHVRKQRGKGGGGRGQKNPPPPGGRKRYIPEMAETGALLPPPLGVPARPSCHARRNEPCARRRAYPSTQTRAHGEVAPRLG